MRIRGVVFQGSARPPRIEELELDPPGPGEVLVRMAASGVCRSDLHVIDGDWQRPTDVVLGHEGAAFVEVLGPGVAERPAGEPLGSGGLRVGDLVVLAWTAPCGRCVPCCRREAWLCSDPRGAGHRLAPSLARLHRADGSSVGAYSGIGTWGEREVVAAEAAIPIEPSTPPHLAALIGCAVTTGIGAALETARIHAGETVVIIGTGGVGLSVVMGAAAAGASVIVALDTVETKLSVARLAGATHTIPIEPGHLRAAAEAVRQIIPGGADHALEAIGRTDTVELVVDLVRPGGTVTLVGMTPQGARAGIDVYRFVEDGKRLLGSNYGSATPAVTFPSIARWYAEGRLPLALLVTERIPLEGTGDALAAMRAGDGLRRVIRFD